MINIVKQIPKSTYLLFSILLFIFIGPLLDKTSFKAYINIIIYTFIFLGTFSIIEKKTRFLKTLLIIGLVQNIILFFIEVHAINIISFTFSAIVFAIITFILIFQIARSNRIDNNVIVEAINGYLLIGVVATLLNSVILQINPEAINFSSKASTSGIIYYSYISLTTIGFGDLSPQSPIARSISVFVGLAGQLYLTIIIAFIVGKVSNSINSQ